MINQSNFENNEELVIKDIGMSDKIRSRVVKEKLPENLGAVMENMQAGQSVFIKATHVTNVKRKMYALRSKYYRWRQKMKTILTNLASYRRPMRMEIPASESTSIGRRRIKGNGNHQQFWASSVCCRGSNF